jgi:hypothetical protein
MKSPPKFKWLREQIALGREESRVETAKEFDDDSGIYRIRVTLPDERAIQRRKRIIAIAMNPWVVTIVAGLVVAALAKLFGLI